MFNISSVEQLTPGDSFVHGNFSHFWAENIEKLHDYGVKGKKTPGNKEVSFQVRLFATMEIHTTVKKWRESCILYDVWVRFFDCTWRNGGANNILKHVGTAKHKCYAS